MTKFFEVVDLRAGSDGSTKVAVEAPTPEAAVLALLGIEVVRSGVRRQLAAKVYWQNAEKATNLVRLYTKVASDRIR